MIKQAFMLRILINSCEIHCVSHHKRSRLRPILLLPPSPFSRLRRLTPPFSVSGILSSSSSHARLWPSQLKPKHVSVLGKSKKKEEPVLEDLPKEYCDDSKP
ncbi:uncharacterized protein LOC108867641 [Pyrus x bretschneideri]|uniref:uncharacterized protein LOC108867641 n=1 Tax=Pyrus x bretschneideri TaxID=225117 RepID=UPI000870836F|nr:uncharacterized protein LOC108867641 [Pyrus x bretschneideri]